MSFQVDVLPVNTRIPGNYIGYDTSNALRGVQIGEKYVCIVSLMTTGSAEENVVYDVASARQAISLFGRGSPAHTAYLNALATYPFGNYRVAAVKQTFTGGVSGKASGSIAFDGTAVDGGSITVTIGQESVRIPVFREDNGAAISDRLLAALEADSITLEVAVKKATNPNTIEVEALCGGSYGNTIGIEISADNAEGIDFEVADMASGADGNLALSETFQNMAGLKNDIVVFPFNWESNDGSSEFGDVVKYIDKVSSPIEKNPAVCIIGENGNLFRVPNLPKVPNHPRFVFVNHPGTNAANHAVLASVAAKILEFADPSLPINGEALQSVKPSSQARNYLRSEADRLLSSGISPLDITSGRLSATVRIISTHTEGVSQKAPDLWIRVLDFVAEAVRTKVSAAISRQKNTERMLGSVRAVILGELKGLERLEIVKNVDLWKNMLVVERMPENIGFFRVKIPVDAVLGLHGTMGHLELIVS